MLPVKIVYVSALPLLAQGLQIAIETFEPKPLVEIVVVENDPCQELQQVLTFKPDLVFLASNLPGCLDFIAKIRQKLPQILIMVMGFHYHLPDLASLSKAGVQGIVSTTDNLKQLEVSINETLNRQPDNLRRQYARVARTLYVPDLEQALTSREMQILRWLPTDLNYKQIGEQLGIAEDTVSKHVKKMCQKLGVETVRGLLGATKNKRLW